MNKKPILNYISSISKHIKENFEILDLGIGKGDFGKLIKQQIKLPVKITGIEIWGKYRNKKWDYYDKIVVNDIRNYINNNDKGKKYNVVLLIDVLEHFDKFEGKKILNKIISFTQEALIISTPLTKCPQGARYGNPYEVHKTTWKESELFELGFRKIYSGTFLVISYLMFAKLGIFVFERRN